MSMRSRRSVGPVMANMTTGGAVIGGVPTATSAAPLIPAVIVAPATTTFVPSVPTQATVHEHEAFIPSPSVPLHLRTSTTPPPPTTTVVVNTNGTNANGNSNMNNPNVHVVVDDRGPTTTAIVSDLSTLECESVQADPHWTPPTTPEMPFVPPLEISIPVWKRTTPPPPAPSPKPPVNPAHSSSSYRGSNINSNTIRKPKLMTRQASCHSRFFQQHQQYTTSAANYVTDSELVEEEEDPVMILPQNALEGDDEDAVASYYTSPTDMLYLSDESEMILPETSPNNHNNPTTTSRRSKTKTMRREFQKLFRRNRHKVVRPKPQHQQPSHDDDYESFASSRGCLI